MENKASNVHHMQHSRVLVLFNEYCMSKTNKV